MVEKEADRILQLSNVNPTFVRGKEIIDMLNILFAAHIGPGQGDKTKWSAERKAINEKADSLSAFHDSCWMKSEWNRDELISFLKGNYGLIFYCQNTDMGNEWLRKLHESKTPQE